MSGNTGDSGVLIVQQGDGPQDLLSSYAKLLLNYQYGLAVDLVGKWPETGGGVATVWITPRKEQVPAAARRHISAGPFFLLCPSSLIDFYAQECAGLSNVHLCAWEKGFAPGPESLQQQVATAFGRSGIQSLAADFRQPGLGSGRRLKYMLENLETLPTMPQLVLRIMRMVNDPNSTAADLEQLLISDGAIVHKLLQVVNSPIFTGQHSRPWTLKEAIVRLGGREVGTIAQQIKLINSFVKPDDASFDLRRYWVHALGSAVIADRICRHRLMNIKGRISFNEYWLGALLHDVGKLVLGCFYASYFRGIIRFVRNDAEGQVDFRQIEERFGDVPNHEYIGRLLTLKAKMPRGIIEAVGGHHLTESGVKPLGCLIHVAENMSKDLGLGYLPEERGSYHPVALRMLGVDERGLRQVQSYMGKAILAEIQEMVDHCLS